MTTVEHLREVFHYDPETGALTWRVRPSRAVAAGSKAGSLDSDGYRVVGLRGKLYKVHRIAFAMMTGEWPREEIDHRNCVRDDNRWANLRLSTSTGNKENKRAPQMNNQSGFLGVCFVPRRKKFRASITTGGRKHNLGDFSTAEEAHAVYVTAKRRLHGSCTI